MSENNKTYYVFMAGKKACDFSNIGCNRNLFLLKSKTFKDATKEVFDLLDKENEDGEGLGYDSYGNKYPIKEVTIIEATKSYEFDIDGYYEKRDATVKENKRNEKERSERDEYKKLKAKFDKKKIKKGVKK